ncbi:KdsC family phosphatase [Kineobactrum salinum]|uniref:3-deoxy-D-manno-octulosonate 8-phosphate phosphatase KdsC n=1 Tax=Kineobactrum salinum TaxID=2708301 RepID=A0A6C0U3C7_9GAMM|nr:HAD-IIIA family hydrolase [Kineobactrum salinum]QIB66591.1 HAD-IIIA family hydrolase [Kineobactrum salinum]
MNDTEAVILRGRGIRLLALDVDGVLTDGRVIYGSDGSELKAFNIKDGLGIKLLQQAGIGIALITGRQSSVVTRRATELGIDEVIQGREDKLAALRELCQRCALELQQCAYMGDDLPDLAAIQAAGLGMTVADAAAVVRARAHWCSAAAGGAGAVREACEWLLRVQGSWPQLEAGFQ